jgi:molybdopterin-guanine dinucleotide biosynthesis protein A
VVETGVLVAVLAGGRARRLGGDKAGAVLAGRPLIAYPLAAAREAGLDAVVVAKPAIQLPQALGAPVVLEPAEPSHPLCGVLAALANAGPGRAVLALACDTPFVTGELVAWLASLEGPAMIEAGGRPQPLPGLYPPGAERRLADAIERCEPTGATLASLGARVLSEAELARFGDPARLLFNVNEPGDLAEAQRLVRG